MWRSGETPALIAATLGVLLVLSGAFVPSRLGPVFRGWMAVAHAISRVTTPLFMGIVYFVIVWPLGWARRSLGSNPLVHEASDGGFWKARSGERGDMRRQF